jgi:hypothetical protein
MAVSTISRDDEAADDPSNLTSLAVASNGTRERKNSSGLTLRDQYNVANPDTVEQPQQHHQLPSPEATPSPRSSSPSLVVTDTSSVELTDAIRSENGHGRSRSFEHKLNEHEEVGVNGILSPKPISKKLPPHELHDIPEEKPRRSRKLSLSKSPENEGVLKLSPLEIKVLTGAPESLPLPANAQLTVSDPDGLPIGFDSPSEWLRTGRTTETDRGRGISPSSNRPTFRDRGMSSPTFTRPDSTWSHRSSGKAPHLNHSVFPLNFTPSDGNGQRRSEFKGDPLDVNGSGKTPSSRPRTKSNILSPPETLPSPTPQDLPLPPMSIPTYLQLELASSRPSPLYIHRSSASEYPYESSRIKFERLLNFLLLPPQLEQVLLFGSLACLDAWLHTFTILPLRFLKAIFTLMRWWGVMLTREAQYISGFIYHGSGRFWGRRRGRSDSVDSVPASRSTSRASRPSVPTANSYQIPRHSSDADHSVNGAAEKLRVELERKPKPTWGRRHRRTKSQPSTLSIYHKADLLQGAVIISSCLLLMMFDASRMYHSIRGQSAMKLYMVWNVLEVRL